MQRLEPQIESRFESKVESQLARYRQVARAAASLAGILLLCWLAGCGSSKTTATQTSTTASPQTYFAPYLVGLFYTAPAPLAYTIDDVADSFSDTTYQPFTVPGPQLLNAGVLTVNQRGLRSLGITNSYAYNGTVYDETTYPASSPEPGSYAVELAGQAGGLVQMLNQPVEPLVAATQCPSSSAQTYQFVTIPAGWNPTTDTAYGSVDIVSSGSTVTLQNINQYTLPSVGGTGAPAQPSASSVTGACGPTFFGSITTVPGQLVITDPGDSSTLSAQAEIGIGPTGLLVENNGSGSAMAGTSPVLDYENVLGAGTGAVGLPQPSSALDTGAVVGAQYLGFIYAAGAASPAVSWSSNLASFGFSTVPSNCASVAASTSTLIYGGDFPNGNPASSSNGFGNCDFAIDLGPQDSSNNGLYPNATVWVGTGYAGNIVGSTYSFSAVAIAGQLGGKYAIFLIGLDSTQPWAIYLLQSN